MKVYSEKANIILNSQFRDPLLNHITEKIISHLHYARGRKVLDLGCGVGRVSVQASLRGFSVLGIDIEKKAITVAKEKSLRLGLENLCKFKFSNVFEVTYLRDDKFDVVICAEMIEHVERPDKIINIAYKVLKEGGLLILTTPHDSKQWTVLDEYAQHLKRFKIKEIRGLLSDFKILELYTIGFPFMRYIFTFYNFLSKAKLIKHDAKWRNIGKANNIYNFIAGMFLKIDDLFNSFNFGTTIVVCARKSKKV